MNCSHGRKLKRNASFFKWGKSKWINSVILSLKCVNFNRTVSLVETLFCQKFSNQSCTQQQLVKMAALALKAVPVAQGSLASGTSFACEELLLLIPGEGVGRSSCHPQWWGWLSLHSCLQRPQFPSFTTLQLRNASFLAVSHTKMQIFLFQSEWQTMTSQGFTSYPTAQI